MLSTRPECSKASKNVKPRVNHCRHDWNHSASYMRPLANRFWICDHVDPVNGPCGPISRKRSCWSDNTNASSSSVRQHAIAATTAPADVPEITFGSILSAVSALSTPRW